MITRDRFKQLMNTDFVMNMLTTHKCDEMIVTPDEELHRFRINSKRDGKDLNYSIMYHFARNNDDELTIISISDINYNNLIKWTGEKYELIPYQTNVPFIAIEALLYLMNKAIVYNRTNVEATMRKWICKMEDNPDIAEFSWMDHTKDNGDYEIIIDYSNIPRRTRVYAHFENGVLYEIRCRSHKDSYSRPSISNDNFEDTCWICNNKETGLKYMSYGILSAELLYDMLKDPTEDLLPLTLKEGKKKMTKQKKKVYPNIFNKDKGASIKDVQIHHKKGTTTTTVVWSDLDEKGKNRITKVSCPTVQATTETGIAMCIAKRYFGGRNEFKRVAVDALALHNKRAVAREHRAEVKSNKKEHQS